MSSTVTCKPAGKPSTMTTSAWPWDSPAVRKRSTHQWYRWAIARSGGFSADEAVRQQHHEVRAGAQGRPERERGLAPAAEGDDEAHDHADQAPEEHRDDREIRGLGQVAREPAREETEHQAELHVTEAHPTRR